MAEYIKKTHTVNATHWRKDGDHPAVADCGKSLCHLCKQPWMKHGIIGGRVVCPDSWIIEVEKNRFIVRYESRVGNA